jgi:xanthine dehydrogenase accessory factor
MHAVMRTDPDYTGLIGSKRRTSIVIDRLREKGASEERLKKIHAPIGLDIGAISSSLVTYWGMKPGKRELRGGVERKCGWEERQGEKGDYTGGEKTLWLKDTLCV